MVNHGRELLDDIKYSETDEMQFETLRASYYRQEITQHVLLLTIHLYNKFCNEYNSLVLTIIYTTQVRHFGTIKRQP